eukprot:gene10121-8021_t
MQLSRTSVTSRAFKAQQPRSRIVVSCSAKDASKGVARREALLAAGGFLLVSQLSMPQQASAEKLRTVMIPVSSLSSFQRADILDDFRLKAEAIIKSGEAIVKVVRVRVLF